MPHPMQHPDRKPDLRDPEFHRNDREAVMTPRRLLRIAHVAEKLDCSPATFTRNRHALETNGFPLPCLPDDVFGSERWDEKAIDLWLDDRIPQNLQGKVKPHQLPDSRAIEQTLQQRARDLSL